MMQTTAVLDGNHWVINGRKAFITGAEGAELSIIRLKTDELADWFPAASVAVAFSACAPSANTGVV